MPAALERKLKRQVAGKNWSEERKDAYVYGTLRKTGWKPSTQKKKKQMSDSSKLVQLEAINQNLDGIIQFAYDDEDDKTHPYLKTAAAAGTGAAVAGGGILAHQAIKRGGGYGALIPQARVGYALGKAAGPSIPYGQALKTAAGAATKAPGAAIGGLAGITGSKISDLLAKIAKPAATALQSKERTIRFNEDQAQLPAKKVQSILQPFAAAGPLTKITQEQFPAGKSPNYQRDPTAEILKLPFPDLMRLLKQKNILQEQFPGFSKLGKLVELDSRLDGIIEFKAIEPLNPAHKGALTRIEKKTGESAEELKHSKNPLTRKRATFAVNAAKWHH